MSFYLLLAQQIENYALIQELDVPNDNCIDFL